MKTKTYLCAAFIAASALNGAAYAEHQPGHPAPEARGTNTATANDDASMAWRMARYPFRVGRSVVRTPLIVGQTFTGKRSFISNRGFFQTNEEPPAAADQRNSVPQGRGQRTPAR